MKRLLSILMVITLVIASVNYTPKNVEAAVTSANGSDSWSLVWSDEFNQTAGSTVNSDYWQFDTGYGSSGWGNNEVQNYVSSTDAVRVLDVDGAVDGKALAITAKRQSDGTITSGRIKTLDKQYVKYGKIEARIRTVNGMQPGVWPAFWMMGNDINSVGWPNCGEIDIMEHRNAETQMISTLHWNPNADGTYAHSYAGSETNGQFGYFSSMDDWHTYAVEWYEDCMKFFLDGNCFETLTLTDEMKEEFHKPHFILLNLAIGSTSTPFTLYTTVDSSWTESSMYVDYVRLYQGTDANFSRALSSDTSSVVTTASPTAGLTQCTYDAWTAAGDVWDYNIGNSWAGASAYYAGGSQNDFTIYLSSASTANWGAMIRANQSVTAGHTYNYTINYTSSAAGSALVKEDVSSSDEKTVDINSGNGTITGTFTAGASQTTAQLLMDLRGIESGTKIQITGLSLTDVTPEAEETTTTASSSSGSTSYDDLEWTQVGSTDYYVAAMGNEFPFQNVNDQGTKMEIVPSVAQGTRPIWPAFADETLNGNSGTFAIGAGIFINYADLTMNAYNVYEATSAVDVRRFQIIIKAGNPGASTEEPTEAVTDAPTEAVTDAPTDAPTEAVSQPGTVPGLMWAGNESLPYYWAWGTATDAESYNFYINGELIASQIGKSYNAESYFATAQPGTYTIGVSAVNAAGESEITTIEYVVADEEATTTVEETTTVVEEETDPSAITDWTLVNGSSTISYYICDNKADKVTVKPQIEGDNIYTAYSLAAVFSSATLNGVEQEIPAGAFYRLPLSSVTESGYYTVKVVDYYGNETVSIIYKVEAEAVTEAPTTVEETTTVAEEDGYTDCATGANTYAGQWGYYVGADWAGASARYLGGTTLNDFSLKILTTNQVNWGVQAFTAPQSLTVGNEYTVTIKVNSSSAADSVIFKDDVSDTTFETKALVAGENTFTGTFTAANETAEFFFDLGLVPAQTTWTVTSYTLVSNSSEETTTATPSVTLTAPTDVEVFNFYAQESGYRVDFEEVADATAYKVYVDNSDALATVTASGSYVPASSLTAYADDGLHSVYVTAVDANGNESAKSDAATVRITALTNSTADPTDITRIYVVTNGGTKGGADITKADKTPASLTIISGESIVNTVSDGGTIKRRGNSTSLADKPAYNISFNSKQEVISGAAKGKKWSLLANAFDKTLMRSKLAMDLGAKLGNVATPMQRYADLYIDGVYQGSYLISEPADNGRSGVEMDDSDDGIDIMFELEADRVESDQTYYTTGLGVRLVTNEPEGLDTATSRYTYWVDTLTAFETALKNTSSDDVFNYIDMDSFVDMYIANEYFKTVDFGYSSVKYYITYDENNQPTIHAGALWDFDLSSGNSTFEDIRSYEGLRGQQVNTWFGYLMQNNTFKNAVIAKFTEMQPTIQNIYKANELGDSQINQLLAYMGNSKDRNYSATSEGGAGWSETVVDSAENKYYPYSYGTIAPYNTYTYEQHIEFLTDWLENRNIWLCDTWGVEYDYTVEDEIVVSEDLDVTGWQMTSTFDNVEGSMGIRTVYQVEDTVDGQEVSEVGLVYGLIYGDNPITAEDVVYGSDNAFVATFAGTSNGISEEILGDSTTATYYVRTMSCGLADGSDNITAAAYTAKYYVRAYAKLADGSIVYSDAYTYTIFDVADVLYQNNMVNTESTYNYLYTKILSYVDPTYVEGDFDWSNTIVK